MTTGLALRAPVVHYPAAMVTGKQIRAAMGMLGWTNKDLSAASGVHVNTVQRLTNSAEDKGGNAKSWSQMQKALQAAGIDFFDGDTPIPPGGPGVRLRDKPPA